MVMFLTLLPIALALFASSRVYLWAIADRTELPAVQLFALRHAAPAIIPVYGCPQRPCHARLRSRLSPAIR